jgi:hypothetical protein
VPGHVSARAVDEAERVLQFAADSQHRGAVATEVDGQRCVPARAANRQLPTVDDADHRVVARHVDRPVVVERRVAECRKTRRGIVFGEADGLVGAVGTGEHQRVGHLGIGSGDRREQQVMDRRIRQHQAQQRAAGCDGISDRSVGASAQQHDRPSGAGEHGGLGVADMGIAAGDVEIAHQHRKRLGATRLTAA